jgi:hypothetical protein
LGYKYSWFSLELSVLSSTFTDSEAESIDFFFSRNHGMSLSVTRLPKGQGRNVSDMLPRNNEKSIALEALHHPWQ